MRHPVLLDILSGPSRRPGCRTLVQFLNQAGRILDEIGQVAWYGIPVAGAGTLSLHNVQLEASPGLTAYRHVNRLWACIIDDARGRQCFNFLARRLRSRVNSKQWNNGARSCGGGARSANLALTVPRPRVVGGKVAPLSGLALDEHGLGRQLGQRFRLLGRSPGGYLADGDEVGFPALAAAPQPYRPTSHSGGRCVRGPEPSPVVAAICQPTANEDGALP